MRVTLTDDEVREALLNAVSEKLQHNFGDLDPDRSWIDVTASGKEVEDLEEVTFTCEIMD